MSLIPQIVVAFSKYDLTGGKNVVTGAEFTVEFRTGGEADIFADEAGEVSIVQPALTNDAGELKFYIATGSYFYTLNGSTYSKDVGQSPLLYTIDNVEGTDYDFVYLDSMRGSNLLLRLTESEDPKTFNVLPFSESGWPVGIPVNIRNAGDSPLTVVPGEDVTINGALEIPPNGNGVLICVEEDTYDMVMGGGGGNSGKMGVLTLTDEATYQLTAADAGKFIVTTDDGVETVIYLPEADDESIEVGMFWWVYRSLLGSSNINISYSGVTFQVPVQGSTTLRTRGVARIVCIDTNTYMAHGDFLSE